MILRELQNETSTLLLHLLQVTVIIKLIAREIELVKAVKMI